MKTVLFQVIQFSIITQFSSIWPIDRCYHSRPEWTWEQWQWRGSLHFSKLQHYWNLTIRLFNVICRTHVGGGLTSLQRCSWCILQLQLTEQVIYCDSCMAMLRIHKSVWYAKICYRNLMTAFQEQTPKCLISVVHEKIQSVDSIIQTNQ